MFEEGPTLYGSSGRGTMSPRVRFLPLTLATSASLASSTNEGNAFAAAAADATVEKSDGWYLLFLRSKAGLDTVEQPEAAQCLWL